MHTLVGTFISKLEPEVIQDQLSYPIKIALPPRYSRVIYFTSIQVQEQWLSYLKAASLSMNFADFYEEGAQLGQGSMGDVHLCKHKKSNKEYAVKII